MNKTRKLLLLSSSCLVALFSLGNAYGQNESPEELYSECVGVAGNSLCDFLFKRSAVNPSNLTALIPSNYTDSINSTDSTNSTYLTYNDKDLGFSIQYPSDWSINNGNSEHNSVITFNAPETSANVDIRIFPKGDYKSIKEFGDKTFKEPESEENTLLSYYRNSSTLLGGKSAMKAIYLSTYNPNLFEKAYGYKSYTSKAMMVATMVPEKKSIYSVAYFANSQDFDNYRPVVEKMIDSFQIYGKGPIIQEDNSSSSNP
jgi:hypothetical protein